MTFFVLALSASLVGLARAGMLEVGLCTTLCENRDCANLDEGSFGNCVDQHIGLLDFQCVNASGLYQSLNATFQSTRMLPSAATSFVAAFYKTPGCDEAQTLAEVGCQLHSCAPLDAGVRFDAAPNSTFVTLQVLDIGTGWQGQCDTPPPTGVPWWGVLLIVVAVVGSIMLCVAMVRHLRARQQQKYSRV